MKKALALILALVMLSSVAVISTSAATVDIDMLAVAEAAGYKAAYAGEAINNGPTLDGKVEPGEYTASRTIALEDLFQYSAYPTEVQSDVTEYFAHNENFVYYAIQFVQAEDNHALMPNFKVSNTFDIYKDSTNLSDYFRYRMGTAQFRHGADKFYYTDPAASHSAGQAAPVFRDDIVANSGKDANNVKTYEIRFSKAYFANLLGLEDMSELRVIPYYFYFHSSSAVASYYSADVVAALSEKLNGVSGSWIPPEGEGAYYFMVLDDEVNENDEWEVFHNDLGWNVYVGEALTSNQKLDGVIGENEYTFTRTLSNTTKYFSATPAESDVIEYLAHDADFVYYAVEFKESAGNKACRIDFRYSNSTVFQYAGAHLYQYGVSGTWYTDTIKVYPRLYGNGIIHNDNAIGNSCTGVGAPDPTCSYVNNGIHCGADGETRTAFGADLSMAGSVNSETNVKIYEYRFDKSYFLRSNSRTSYVHKIETTDMVQVRELSWQLWFHNTSAFTGYDPTTAEFKEAILAAGGDSALASKYTARLPMFYILDEAPEGYYDEWQDVTEDLGLNIHVDPVTTAPVLDGKISTDEYPTTRTVKLADIHNGTTSAATSEVHGDTITEYYGHDADFVYYAAQFQQDNSTKNGRAYWLQFRPDNTADIFNSNFGTKVRYNSRYNSGNNYLQGTDILGTNFHNWKAPTNNSHGPEVAFFSGYEAATITKTYEFRISKAYIAAQAHTTVDNVSVIPYFVSFHAQCELGTTLTSEMITALQKAGMPSNSAATEGNVCYNFMILEGEYEDLHKIEDRFNFDMNGTASIRLSHNNPGLRFKTTLSTDDVTTLKTKYKYVKAGTLIAPADFDLDLSKVVNDPSMKEGRSYIDVVADLNNPIGHDYNVTIFAGSITNFKGNNAGRDFEALSYVACSNDGANWTYFYANQETIRSAAYVAQSAIDKGECANDPAGLAILNAYAGVKYEAN